MLHAKGIDAVLSDSGVIWLGKDALRILGLVQPSGRPLIDVLPPAEEEDVRAFEDALNGIDEVISVMEKIQEEYAGDVDEDELDEEEPAGD